MGTSASLISSATCRRLSGRGGPPLGGRGPPLTPGAPSPPAEASPMPSPVFRRGLFPAQDGVLQRLRDPDADHPLGRNPEGLAGLGVATHARLPVDEDHLADPRDDKAVLRFLRRP